MFSGWFNSAPAELEDIIYEELETPITDEDFQTVANKKLDYFLDILKSDSWLEMEFEDEWHQGPIRLFHKDSVDSPVKAVKLLARFPGCPENLLKMVQCTNREKMLAWDPDLLSIDVIKRVGEDIVVTYSTHQAPTMITNREFVLLRACRQLENGCVVYVAFSINYPERKANPQFVRGALIVGGWLIKPVEGDAEAVDVERILQLDPKGNIPAFVVNLKKQQAAISLREMRTALSSFVADDDGK